MTSRPNIVLFLTDQERLFPDVPAGFVLPGRERLRELGTSFEAHQIASCICSASRSNIYTGEHIQRTGVFDNMNFPWSSDLPRDLPTIGHRLRAQGYFTAYLGKWHLSEAMDTTDPFVGPVPEFRETLEEYGFADYAGPGDVIGLVRGGHEFDLVTAALAQRWLRLRARTLEAEDVPWFLAVNIVQPHDVMYFDTDPPGGEGQSTGRMMFDLNKPPRNNLYQATWDLPLPQTRHESWTVPGRPRAHKEYQESRRSLVGLVPDEDERWQRLQDYYLNCIRESDIHLATIVDELDDLGYLDDAVVILTSDHGELAGAHGMSGKGATAYREQNHVPLVIKHPALSAGTKSQALTSHVDLAPTILSAAGCDGTYDELPGHDIVDAVVAGDPHDMHCVRDGTLYSYNMLGYLDAEFVAGTVHRMLGDADGSEPTMPDLAKRGAVRSVFDGRYRLTRYFAPNQHHRPETFDQLLAYNDLELFDLIEDPAEAHNLAIEPEAQRELIMRLNALLNRLMRAEVGVDDGSFLPTSEDGPWEVMRWDL